MLKCVTCGALYTGVSHDSQCEVCVERNRGVVYADPTTHAGWMLRQAQRIAHVQHELVAVLPNPQVGFCPICRRAIDDHKLTYKVQHDALAICVLPQVSMK